MSTFNLPTKAHLENGIIQLDKQFDDKTLARVQRKRMINLDRQAKFIKIDVTAQGEKGEFFQNWAYTKAAVSEAVTSCFARNIKNFESVDYQFTPVTFNGKKETASLADNYLKENEQELVIGNNPIYGNMSDKEFADRFVNVRPKERLQNLTEFAREMGDVSTIKEDLIKQAAFDYITMNTDRMHNKRNFIFAYNHQSDQVRLVNADFRRTLPMIWTELSEANYNEDLNHLPDEEFELMLQKDKVDSIARYHAEQFFKDENFQRFDLDVQQMNHDLNQLVQQIQETYPEIQKFAQFKAESMKWQVQQNQQYIHDISTDLSLDRLTEPAIIKGK